MNKSGQWDWWMVLLWAWSCVAMIFLIIVAFTYQPPLHPTTISPLDMAIIGSILWLVPLIFLIIVGIKNFRQK